MRKVTVSRMRERYAQTVLTFRISELPTYYSPVIRCVCKHVEWFYAFFFPCTFISIDHIHSTVFYCRVLLVTCLNTAVIENFKYLFKLLFLLSMAQQPPVGQSLLNVEASRLQSHTLHSAVLLWTSDQLVALPSQETQETNVHSHSGIRTRDPKNWDAANLNCNCTSAGIGRTSLRGRNKLPPVRQILRKIWTKFGAISYLLISFR